MHTVMSRSSVIQGMIIHSLLYVYNHHAGYYYQFAVQFGKIDDCETCKENAVSYVHIASHAVHNKAHIPVCNIHTHASHPFHLTHRVHVQIK